MNAHLVGWSEAAVGAIGIAWGRSPLARAIEEAEDIAGEGPNPPSHAFLCAPRGCVLEAAWPKVALTPRALYQPHWRGERLIEPKVELYQLDVGALSAYVAYQAVCDRWLGTWYNVAGLVGFVPVELARGLGIGWVRNLIAGRRQVWCSELVGEYLAQPSINCAPPDLQELDPAGLRSWLRAMLSGPQAA